jgi:parvulin-like peptidyl-prolyl isomerase
MVRKLLLLAVSASLVLSACSSSTPAVVQIDSSVVTKAQLDAELNNMAGSARYVQLLQQGGDRINGGHPGSFTVAFVASTLNQLVKYTLVHADLVRRHKVPNPQAVGGARQTISKQFTDQQGSFFNEFTTNYQTVLAERQAEVQALQAVLSTDATNEQYYNAHRAQFASEVCLRDILIARKDAHGNIDYPGSLQQSQQLKDQIQRDNNSFAELAKRYSQDNQGDSSTASKGGQLTGNAKDGCLTPEDLNQLIPSMVRAAATLDVNQVSAPVLTQNGYHLVEVTSRQVPPYSPELKAAAAQGLYISFLQAALLRATPFKVNSRFGRVERGDASSGDVPTIVPPSGAAATRP